MVLKTQIIIWDYNSQAPINEINTALQYVNQNKEGAFIKEVYSNDDSCVVIVSNRKLTNKEAQYMYDVEIDEMINS